MAATTGRARRRLARWKWQTATIDVPDRGGAPEPDFIKCDVEGAEARVVHGARSPSHAGIRSGSSRRARMPC